MSSSINYNSQQNVTRNLTLIIKNSVDPITLKGLNNWGADYSNNRQKWWLDKRLAVFIQVRLSNRRDADYWEMPMGVFIITGLSSSHTLTTYPTTTIQASSAEVLYSSRRGKFDKNVTITRGSSIIDGIKRILIQGGEKPENIMISPDVAGDTGSSYMKDWEDKYHYIVGSYVQIIEYDPIITTEVLSIRFFKCIEEHNSTPLDNPVTGINKNLYWTETAKGNLTNKDYRTVLDVYSNGWIVDSNVTSKVAISEDRTTYRTKYSSTMFTFNDLDKFDSGDLDINSGKILATYTFKDSSGNIAPIDFSQWDTAAFYARCDKDIYNGTFQIWFYNGKQDATGKWQQTGLPFKLNIGELVGNVTQTRITSSNGILSEQLEERENWRMMIIPLGFINELDSVYQMSLVFNKPVSKVGYNVFKFWIDDIIVSKVQNILDNPLNYTISQNRWQAIKEMADLMLCEAYYTRDGYFLLTKEQLLSPNTYIDNIREYLKWSPGFGPFNTNINPTINKIPPFNLIETESIFQFEPFYNFRNWLLVGNRSGPANILKISTNNLYNYNLVQPNTYFGDFIINIGLIYSLNPSRAQRIINHVGLGKVSGYFPEGLFYFENGSSFVDIPLNQIIKCNLVSLLYYNTEHKSGNYNYWALDDLFGLTDDAALIVDNNEFEAVFVINKEGNYRVPQEPPVITFSDLQEDWRKQTDYSKNLEDKRDAFYAGGSQSYDEKELANHIITYGGTEEDPIMGKAEGVLTEDGLVLRVKGKYINERGRVRGINNMDAPTWQLAEEYMPTWAPKWLGSQFYFSDTFIKHLDQRTQAYEFYRCLKEHLSSSNNEPMTGVDWSKYWKKEIPGELLNKDTDVDRLYKGCFNLDIVKEVLGQDKFLHLTEQPIANFTVEKIGDFIYHHNQGQPDKLLKWTWELKNRVIWELKKRLSYSQKFSFQIKPYYGLDCFDIIKIHDRLFDIVGTGIDSGTGERFKIETINIPLNGSYMSITASREYGPNIGIPSFNESHKFRWGPYFYGIDVLGDNNVNYRASAEAGKQVLYEPIKDDITETEHKVANLVYCIDTTGSMTTIIKQVADGLIDVTNNLQGNNNFTWNLGLVGYGDLTINESMSIYNFTSNFKKFESQIRNIPRTAGGDLPESALDAIDEAINLLFPYVNQVNNVNVIILVTDAETHPSIKGNIMTDFAKVLARYNIYLFSIIPLNLFSYYGRLGGKSYNILGNFSTIFDDIFSITSSIIPGYRGRNNVGGGSNVSPRIKNSDAPDNKPYPGRNYAHFYTQRYPLKHKWGTGLGEDNKEDGITLTKLYKVKPGIGIPSVKYMKNEILLTFTSNLLNYDGTDFSADARSAFTSNPSIITDAIYDKGNRTILIQLLTPIPDKTTISLNSNIIYISQGKTLTTISIFDFKYILSTDSWEFTEETIDAGIIMPGNPGKAPGYTIEDIQRHMGYAIDEIWYSNPYFGQGGADWRIGLYYEYGAIVRIPAVRKWSTIESYIFMSCLVSHVSTLSSMPEFDPETNTPKPSVYWKFHSTDNIPWVIGQPISLTYDFYDISFFEGEMSLEKGYAATPVTNGEAIWELLGADDDDLKYAYRWMYKNGKLTYSRGLETGFANKNIRNSSTNTLVNTQPNVLSFNNINTPISKELNTFLEQAIAPNEVKADFFENGDMVTVETPSIKGYELNQMQNMYTYNPNLSPNYTIEYKKEVRGTVVVRHVWIYNNKEIDIIQQQVFSNIHERIVKSISSNTWIRVTKNDSYSIEIEENDQIKTFIFEYSPIPDWSITNNFHNLSIEPMFIDEYNYPFLTVENPVYILDMNNICWIEKNKIFISGKPKIKIKYIIYGKFGNVENSLASIAINHKNKDFGHFFSPSTLLSIKYYEQKYSYIEIDEVTRVCDFNFSFNEPKDILILK